MAAMNDVIDLTTASTNPNFGSSVQRHGQMYFDSTLDISIWYNGSIIKRINDGQ